MTGGIITCICQAALPDHRQVIQTLHAIKLEKQVHFEQANMNFIAAHAQPVSLIFSKNSYS